MNGRYWVNNHAHILRSRIEGFNGFLCHQLNHTDYSKYVGRTTRLKLTQADMLRIDLVIPSLSEGVRIADHINDLFGEIEAGEQELLKAREGLETYRRAMLKTAVTGELTKDWRAKDAPNETGADLLAFILKERRAARERFELMQMRVRRRQVKVNVRQVECEAPGEPDSEVLPELPPGWVWSSVGQLFRVYTGATPSRSEPGYWGGDVPWASSGEVAFCRIAETRELITARGLEETSTRLHPVGTVLLAMIGEGKTRGQAAILDIPACNSQNSAAIRVSETPVPPDYIYHVLMYLYEQNRRMSAGGNQKALNADKVKSVMIPLPPAQETGLFNALYI